MGEPQPFVERIAAWRADRRVGVAIVACIAVAAGVAWFRSGAGAGGTPASAVAPTEVSHPVATTTASVPALVVDVVGAVRAPGVVRMPAGSRVVDAIAAAGGATGRADTQQLNLAAKLSDGERIAVPKRGEVVPQPIATADGGDPSGASAGPVNLNTATAAQLDALPGVGPATAAAIVADREAHGPFRTVDDLARVRGIGPAKLAALHDLVTV